jgi:(p)ppGpp synthase/HD superfamily hydrolase
MQAVAEAGDTMLTDRFNDALAYAERLHRRQRRKGNDIPYVAHLLAVAAIVLEWGGDEDTAIAALLHDAVEDQGGLETAEAIRQRFGDDVAQIVLACTDSTSADPAAKSPWEARKRAHIAKLAGAGKAVAQVTAADKLHNLSAMIRDVRRDGPATLRRFNAGPDRLLWYFRSIADALEPYAAVAPVAEIRDGADTLARLAGLDPG